MLEAARFRARHKSFLSRLAITHNARSALAFAHVGFHAKQRRLGIGHAPVAPVGRIIEMAHGRYETSLHMELDALARAVAVTGGARIELVFEALSTRFARSEAFNRDMAAWEVLEGTPTYTEMHLLFTRSELNDIVQVWAPYLLDLIGFDPVEAITLFPYTAGALYGMLLDDFGVTWRPYVNQPTDFGRLLAEAVGFVIE